MNPQHVPVLLVESLAERIVGPIVVIGAGGFIGSNLMAALRNSRDDVIGFSRARFSWRQSALGLETDIFEVQQSSLIGELQRIKPQTVFNLSAYGAYPDQQDLGRSVEVNIGLTRQVVDWCSQEGAILVHAGSSSEYGSNSDGPLESGGAFPNSVYAVTKLAGTQLVQFAAVVEGARASVLRLYSVYGPFEEPRRLIPALVREGARKRLPVFGMPSTSRDFIFISDVVEAFCEVAFALSRSKVPPILNIGTGRSTTLQEVAETAGKVFGISDGPVFGPNLRDWDVGLWRATTDLARETIGWKAKVSFETGLRITRDWYATDENFSYLDPEITSTGLV